MSGHLLEASINRNTLRWRQRADLRIVPLEFSQRRSWGVKDPVTLAYFELSEEEYFVLQRLDGSMSAEEICTAFATQFRPKTLVSGELLSFVGQLASQGLLVAEGQGYGDQLAERAVRARSRRRWARLANLLCIRFRGVDPDRFLGWILPRVNWLFSPGAAAASMTLIVVAIVLIAVQFDRVLERMPDIQALLSPANLIWLTILLAAVKVLHELGHGLACKRFGGECRELGAMLLVMTPTLYCNVSDMWMVRDKWKRIAVSAAGMWVEATIAAVCTILWWFSTPGLFHSLCFNLMFLCSVSTIVFNGNPLLRYDGYFILSDWLEIPNLQQQSLGQLRAGLAKWFCGIPNRDVHTAPRRVLLTGYGIAALAYRLMLTFLILWSLYLWLQPRGLGVVVQLIAVPSITLMAGGPLLAAVRFFGSAENQARINWTRLAARGSLAAALLGLVLTVPLPCRVSAGALLDHDAARQLHATLGGALVSQVKPGDFVREGDVIARLEDPRIEAELIRLQGEYRQHQLRLEQLEIRRIREPDIAELIPAAREASGDYAAQVEQLQRTARQLTLRAPQDGIVIPPPRKPQSLLPGSLPAWTGSPLEARNQGCYVQAGTTVCLVGPAHSRGAILLVSQDDINLVRVGQRVKTTWRELSGEVLSGQVTEIAALDLGLLPRDAVQRLQLPARATTDGTIVPVGTWYQVRVALDASDRPLVRGSAGQARIVVDPQSLGTSFLRWFTRTFAV